MTVDSSNLFAVVVTPKGDTVLIHNAVPAFHQHTDPLAIDREEAINLAAWIQVLADPGGKRTQALIAEIRKQ